MKPPVELFDDACDEWGFGPRLSDALRDKPGFQQVEQHAYRWIEEIRKKENVKGLIPFHINFIENTSLNAAVDIRVGVGLVGLFIGAVVLPVDAFKRLLSHPEVLPHIGDRTREVVGPQHSDGVFDDFDQLAKLRIREGRRVEVPPPADPIRRACGEQLTTIALDFLIGHEIAHIVNGHVGYLLDACGIQYMLELSGTTSSKPGGPALDKITRQAIELNADMSGVAMSMGIINTVQTRPDSIPSECQTFLRTPEDALYLWAFAITWLFYLWGLHIRFDELDTKEHPPAGLRVLMCQGGAETVIRQYVPWLVPKVHQIGSRAFADAMASAQKLGGNISAAELRAYTDAALDRRCKDHAERIVDRFHDIKRDLNRFAYLKADIGPKDTSTNV